MKMLSVRLDDAEFAELSRLCEQLGETRSEVVKRSIAAFVRAKPPAQTPHQLAERLGMIGSFKGSSNLSETVPARLRQKLRAESARRR